MANFATHIGVAAAGGGLAAISGWQAGWWSAADALPLAALVSFGGILPDIDSDHSKAIRLIFNLFAVFAVIAGALMLQTRLTPGQLVVACGGLYVGVRYLAGAIFKRFTVHRGIWHSLLASGLCALIATALSYRLFAQGAEIAWLQGLALWLGSVIHLLLDELYSVDLMGGRLKRSFGTALKLCDLREPGNSVLMLLLAACLSPWLPPWPVLLGIFHHGAGFLR